MIQKLSDVVGKYDFLSPIVARLSLWNSMKTKPLQLNNEYKGEFKYLNCHTFHMNFAAGNYQEDETTTSLTPFQPLGRWPFTRDGT